MMLDRWVEEHATHGGAPEQALAACRRDLRAPVDPAAFLAAVEGVPASRNRLYFAPPKASLVLAQARSPRTDLSVVAAFARALRRERGLSPWASRALDALAAARRPSRGDDAMFRFRPWAEKEVLRHLLMHLVLRAGIPSDVAASVVRRARPGEVRLR